MRLLRLDDLIAFYTNARPFFSYRLRKNGWIEQKVCIVPSRAIYLGSFSKDLPLDRGKLASATLRRVPLRKQFFLEP